MDETSAPKRAPLRLLSTAAPTAPVPARDEPIERALQLMQRDLAAPWTVTALARRVGMSRPVFARRFRALTGVSPMRYLTRARMQRAKELLAERALSLAQVALRVGYSSEFAFNRAFKRAHRVAPGSFRKLGLRAPVFRMAA